MRAEAGRVEEVRRRQERRARSGEKGEGRGRDRKERGAVGRKRRGVRRECGMSGRVGYLHRSGCFLYTHMQNDENALDGAWN